MTYLKEYVFLSLQVQTCHKKTTIFAADLHPSRNEPSSLAQGTGRAKRLLPNSQLREVATPHSHLHAPG